MVVQSRMLQRFERGESVRGQGAPYFLPDISQNSGYLFWTRDNSRRCVIQGYLGWHHFKHILLVAAMPWHKAKLVYVAVGGCRWPHL